METAYLNAQLLTAQGTVAELRKCMAFETSDYLTHAQRNGLKIYQLHLLDEIDGYLGRARNTVDREIERSEKLEAMRQEPEDLPF